MSVIKIVNNKFSDFLFFYNYLKGKIFINIFFSFAVGLMDGFGLALFIPLLQMIDGSEGFQTDTETSGSMDYFTSIFEYLGLSLDLTTVLLAILLFFSLKGVFRFIESYYNVILGNYFVKKVRFEAINNISELSYKYFINLDAGKIQNTLSSEVDRVYQAYKNYSAAIQSLVTVFVYMVLAFLTNPQFAVLVIIGGGFSNLVYNNLYKKTKETSIKYTLGANKYHSLMMQQIHNFKYLRATGQIYKYNEKVKVSVLDLINRYRKIGFYNSILVATKEPMSIAVVVIVILIQTYFFGSSLGPIILSLLFFYRALNQIVVFQNLRNSFLSFSGSLINFKDFMRDLKSNKNSYSGKIELKKVEDIEIQNLDFSYGKEKLLKDIYLKIPKNKMIAFVGSSGSGKTTLTNIICGLLPFENGKMLVNGIDIDEIHLQKYQSRIGYITQEPVIFNDSLFNNVTFWSEKNEENLRAFRNCLAQASLTDFYNELDFAEDTPLGSNGVMVSGGQKQRIAIARELYKKVDLLILDEATSSLDSATEKEIQSNFDRLRGDYTIIVIAHRLSTIRNADIIYLLKNGSIDFSGDFSSLYEKSNEFREMVNLQDFHKVDG